MQPLEQQVWDLVEEGVTDLGLRLVRVRLTGGSEHAKLQIMIEPQEASSTNLVSVSVGSCGEVSRMASTLLDVEDLFSGRYELEVSSTGMERPMVTLKDFEEYAGQRIKVEMVLPIEGKRRFYGRVASVENNDVHLVCDEGDEVTLAFADVKFAHLSPSDEELKQFMKQA